MGMVYAGCLAGCRAIWRPGVQFPAGVRVCLVLFHAGAGVSPVAEGLHFPRPLVLSRSETRIFHAYKS